jgi:cystathionine beta-lyase
MPPDVTALWLADMGFKAPAHVRQLLAQRAEHGIFGYSVPTEGYYDSVGSWFARRHNWEIDPRQAVITRGVVHAIYLALDVLTEPGDAVIIQPPVYHPFFEAVQRTGRQVAANPLVESGAGWEIDFDNFEVKARQARAFVLCSPHNPVGRVWTCAELERMAEICLRHGVSIISDEIHQDFVYPGAQHTVTASLSPEVDAATVTCTAPSKTFNLAGLQLANVFAADPVVRRRLTTAYTRQGLSQHPALGLAACEAAYGHLSDPWVDGLIAYLDGTLDLIGEFVDRRLPGVSFTRPEGTYFAWLDLRGLDAPPAEVDRAIVHQAKLWLSEGSSFGAEGAGFKRLNAAAPRAVISDALERLAGALVS